MLDRRLKCVGTLSLKNASEGGVDDVSKGDFVDASNKGLEGVGEVGSAGASDRGLEQV